MDFVSWLYRINIVRILISLSIDSRELLSIRSSDWMRWWSDSEDIMQNLLQLKKSEMHTENWSFMRFLENSRQSAIIYARLYREDRRWFRYQSCYDYRFSSFQSYVNSGIDDELFSFEETKSLIDLMKSWNEVIGILDFTLLEGESIPENITKLAEARYLAKKLKDWTEWDRLRDEISSLGWKMIDEKDGWRVEKV